MKNLFKIIVLLIIVLLLLACGQFITPTPTLIPTITLTSVPTQTTTATIEPTPTSAYNPPTLLPTIDPKSAPELLRKSISVQTVEGLNGHKIQKITGWDYGFRQYGRGRQLCNGYQWLDSSHLLLYPLTGQGMVQYRDGSSRTDLTSQLVVINLENRVSGYPSIMSLIQVQIVARCHGHKNLVSLSIRKISAAYMHLKTAWSPIHLMDKRLPNIGAQYLAYHPAARKSWLMMTPSLTYALGK